MSKINLLPWREDQKRINNNLFYAQLGAGVIITVIIIILIDMYASYRIAVQKANIDYLNTELSSINQQIVEIQGLQDSKKHLLERMNIIQALQTDRPSIVRLLDLIPRIVPESIYLTELSRTDKKDANPQNNTTTATAPTPGSGNNSMGANAVSSIGNALTSKPAEPAKPTNTSRQYSVTIKGIAQTNGSISVFLKKLEEIQWLSDVKLSEVSINKEGQGLNFTIDFVQSLASKG